METLKKEEMSLLVGAGPAQLQECVNDILNSNSTATCICTYQNASLITNENTEKGCRCVCTKQ